MLNIINNERLWLSKESGESYLEDPEKVERHLPISYF